MSPSIDLNEARAAVKRVLELDKAATKGPWIARPRETPLFTGGVTIETLHHDSAWLDREILVKVGVQKDRQPESYYEPIAERNRRKGAFHDRQAELLAELERAKVEVWRSLETYQKALEVI